jgi:magnesium-transporting ATPase (P-type)
MRDKMSNLYRRPSIDNSFQVSIHLAKRWQRRRYFRNRPIRNKNCKLALGIRTVMGQESITLSVDLMSNSVFMRIRAVHAFVLLIGCTLVFVLVLRFPSVCIHISHITRTSLHDLGISLTQSTAVLLDLLVFCVLFCRSLFVLFLLVIVLSVLRFTYSDYSFDIFKILYLNICFAFAVDCKHGRHRQLFSLIGRFLKAPMEGSV